MKCLERARSRAHGALAAMGACIALVLAGCGSVDLVATANIPTPLVVKMPVTVALYLPEEFSSYVHKEERWSTDWNINLGNAQADGIKRLVDAMFERVVLVDSIQAGTQLDGVSAILEPSVEEYAFVTPRDAGSPFFAVSIKYRVNVYSPDGRLADSWGFTGYGTSPSQGFSSSAPLAQATARAMRDAGAKLAVEFREQPIVRGLMPAPPSEASEPSAASGSASGAPSQESPQHSPATPVTPAEPPAQPGSASAPEEPAPTTDPPAEDPPESVQPREPSAPERVEPSAPSSPPSDDASESQDESDSVPQSLAWRASQ